MKERFLTKSRFKLAIECPTKLAYTGKPEYANLKDEDSFLEALAEGGFQVGELAKCYHPGGVLVSTLDRVEAEAQTNELLKRDKVTIFEAALVVGKLYIRVDILRKEGKKLSLIEVKAKSYRSGENMLHQDGSDVMAKWEPYVYDIAFQTHVARLRFPAYEITPYLCLADKSVVASVDGLNQKFFLAKDDRGRTRVRAKGEVTAESLGQRILIDVPAVDVVEFVLGRPLQNRSFAETVGFLAEEYSLDRKVPWSFSKHCKKCEFKRGEDQTLKDGFSECWSEVTGRRPREPLSMSLWFAKVDDYLAEKKYFLTDLDESDVRPKAKPSKKKLEERANKVGLARSDRQWLQIKMAKEKAREPYLDKENLRRALKLPGPFHFIDFETATVAIPFHKGRRPYETLAFQFSHHILEKDGTTLRHHNEFLYAEPGKFPNFEFVRALKKSLGESGGTIFRYSPHENTVLNQIYDQLAACDEPPVDRDELCAWIRTVTKEKGKEGVAGDRVMVDLFQFVVKFYYHAAMGGSNSLKVVLPTILNHSTWLQNEYSKPDYGTVKIPSRNYRNVAWVKQEGGKVVDPYASLPPLFSEIPDEEDMMLLFPGEDIANGGAAAMAYARLQFTEMHPEERKAIETSLLKYCELDTLAMVMLYQYWQDLLK